MFWHPVPPLVTYLKFCPLFIVINQFFELTIFHIIRLLQYAFSWRTVCSQRRRSSVVFYAVVLGCMMRSIPSVCSRRNECHHADTQANTLLKISQFLLVFVFLHLLILTFSKGGNDRVRISNQPDDVNSHLVILSDECNTQVVLYEIKQ